MLPARSFSLDQGVWSSILCRDRLVLQASIRAAWRMNDPQPRARAQRKTPEEETKQNDRRRNVALPRGGPELDQKPLWNQPLRRPPIALHVPPRRTAAKPPRPKPPTIRYAREQVRSASRCQPVTVTVARKLHLPVLQTSGSDQVVSRQPIATDEALELLAIGKTGDGRSLGLGSAGPASDQKPHDEAGHSQPRAPSAD